MASAQSQCTNNLVHAQTFMGFADPPPQNGFSRHFFPSKIGGRPAWLIPSALPFPNASDPVLFSDDHKQRQPPAIHIKPLTCTKCGETLSFILQLYSPSQNDRQLLETESSDPSLSSETNQIYIAENTAFHRSIMLFCCRNPSCRFRKEQISNKHNTANASSHATRLFPTNVEPNTNLDSDQHDLLQNHTTSVASAAQSNSNSDPASNASNPEKPVFVHDAGFISTFRAIRFQLPRKNRFYPYNWDEKSATSAAQRQVGHLTPCAQSEETAIHPDENDPEGMFYPSELHFVYDNQHENDLGVDVSMSTKRQLLEESTSATGHQQHKVLHFCIKCGMPAISKCSQCRLVWYCGKKCQTLDWKLVHKRDCVVPMTTTTTSATASTIISANAAAASNKQKRNLDRVVSKLRNESLFPEFELVLELDQPNSDVEDDDENNEDEQDMDNQNDKGNGNENNENNIESYTSIENDHKSLDSLITIITNTPNTNDGDNDKKFINNHTAVSRISVPDNDAAKLLIENSSFESKQNGMSCASTTDVMNIGEGVNQQPYSKDSKLHLDKNFEQHKGVEVEISKIKQTIPDASDDELSRLQTEKQLGQISPRFQAFQKAISPFPDQVLRYFKYQTSNSPTTKDLTNDHVLWISSKNRCSDNRQDMLRCQYCNSLRIPEFQVLPQLLYFILSSKKNPDKSSATVQNVEDTKHKILQAWWGSDVDWGTLVIYTCPRSCHPMVNGAPVDLELSGFEELVWLQPN